MLIVFFLRIQLKWTQRQRNDFDKAKIKDSKIDINEVIQEDRFSFKKPDSSVLFTKIADTPERTRQTRKREEEGRKEWENKDEINLIFICTGWVEECKNSLIRVE